MTKTVPFNDLTRIHNSIDDKIMNKFSKIVKKNSFFFDHYHENINHYLNPSELFIKENFIYKKK